MRKKLVFLSIFLFFAFFAPLVSAQSPFPTFKEKVGHPLCSDSQGRPIIRLFTATDCEKCKKVEKVFVPVVTELMEENLIVGHLWYKDLGDDLLTPEKEGGVPESEEEICFEFDPRCENSLMVVGCQFYRTGAPHDVDYQAEEEELRGVIERVLGRANQKPSSLTTEEPVKPPFLVIGGIIIVVVVLIVILILKIFRL